jgi:hypothetical protein
LAGRKVFTAGEVLQAADVNDFLMDQTVMVFAGTAARGSAIPSPSEGMVTYLSDSDEVEVFDGSVFKAVGPGKILQVVQAVTTTVTSTSSTSYQDTSLSATITPTATSNKVFIVATIGALGKTDFIGGSSSLRLFRGTVSGTALGSENMATNAEFTENTFSRVPATLTFLDSPSTTSATTYTVGIQSSSTSNTASVRAQQTIILMEVAA